MVALISTNAVNNASDKVNMNYYYYYWEKYTFEFRKWKSIATASHIQRFDGIPLMCVEPQKFLRYF